MDCEPDTSIPPTNLPENWDRVRAYLQNQQRVDQVCACAAQSTSKVLGPDKRSMQERITTFSITTESAASPLASDQSILKGKNTDIGMSGLCLKCHLTQRKISVPSRQSTYFREIGRMSIHHELPEPIPEETVRTSPSASSSLSPSSQPQRNQRRTQVVRLSIFSVPFWRQPEAQSLCVAEFNWHR